MGLFLMLPKMGVLSDPTTDRDIGCEDRTAESRHYCVRNGTEATFGAVKLPVAPQNASVG